MTYFNELWEMDRDDFLTTETYKKTKAYYNRNETYFTPLDRSEVKQPMIFKYLINHETVRPIVNFNRYPFFMKLFDELSGDRRSATESSKEEKFLELLDKLYQLDENERYNRRTAQYINTATYYDENREYLNGIDLFTIIDNTITADNQSNFYKQIFQDLKSNQYARETLQPETTEQTGGYVDYESGTNVEDSQITFTEDKPGTIYSESFM